MLKKCLILTLCASMLLSCFLTGCNNTPAESADSTEAETTIGETTERVPAATDEDTTEDVTAQETEPETAAKTEDEPQPEIGFTRSLSSVTIVSGGSATEAYAAAELQKYLEMKGVSVEEDAYPITLRIDPDLGDDSYKIAAFRKMKDGAIITGGNGRGVIYGVYRFLEEFGGIRFFTPELEVVPEGKLEIATGIIRNEAVFELRQTNWVVSQDADWCLKNSINCHGGFTEEMGGTWTYGAWVHTIGWMTGHGGAGQPCLNDPQNLENAIAAVRQILTDNPTADIISVSQNDNDDYCKCEACAAIDEIEGSPSGNIIRFVNAIAADIAEDYPNVVIDTLAYRYSQAAPKVTKPLPNVCVRLAPLLSCFTHAYNDPSCPRNVHFAKDVEDWSKICERIYVWDYTTNFTYFIPTFENLEAIRQNMRFFAEHNVKGMFAQGNDQCPSGEFGELRAYLLAKLMSDPLMTSEEYYTHMDEFLAAYYGQGWRYIRAYIDMTSGQTGIKCRGCYGAPLEAFDRDRFIVLEDTMDSWWDKAEELAGDRLPYVQRSRLQWRYLKLMIHPNEEEAKVFLADVSAAGIHWREWRYTSEIGANSDLSKSPDQWIYD